MFTFTIFIVVYIYYILPLFTFTIFTFTIFYLCLCMSYLPLFTFSIFYLHIHLQLFTFVYIYPILPLFTFTIFYLCLHKFIIFTFVYVYRILPLFQMTQEIEIHRSVSHKHIVKFHKFFEDDRFVYILLELCRRRVGAILKIV